MTDKKQAPERMSKTVVYKALTGYNRFDDHKRVTQFAGHPISIDTTVETNRDLALDLVEKMEAHYNHRNRLLAEYYQHDIEQVKEARETDDPDKLKDALQSLIDAIYME